MYERFVTVPRERQSGNLKMLLLVIKWLTNRLTEKMREKEETSSTHELLQFKYQPVLVRAASFGSELILTLSRTFPAPLPDLVSFPFIFNVSYSSKDPF